MISEAIQSKPVPAAAAQLVTSKSSPGHAGQQLTHQHDRANVPGCGPTIGHLHTREQSWSVLSSCLPGKGDSPNIFGRKSAKICTEGWKEKAQKESWPRGVKVSCTPAGDQQDGEPQAVWFELLEVTTALQVAVKIHTLEQATKDETSPLRDGGSKKQSGTCMDTKETGAETAAHFQTRAQLILRGGKLTLPLLLCFKLHGLSHNYCVVRP